MEELIKNQNNSCEICYKIKCKNCGWEPNVKQLLEVQAGIIVVCPICGSNP